MGEKPLSNTKNTLIVLASGFVTAQIIASVLVYVSNLDLFSSISDLLRDGYLIVPNSHVLPLLKSPGTAFFGGLFFSLSVGIAVTILSFLTASIWCAMGKNSCRFLLVPGGILLLLLYRMNENGLNPGGSAFLIIIPAVVFFVIRKRPVVFRDEKRPVLKNAVLFLSFILPIIFLFPKISEKTFVHFRDDILFNNSTGSKLNDFYYRYTLYPAQLFKSHKQKLLKTCRIDPEAGNGMDKRLESVLIYHDYLPVTHSDQPDLRIMRENDEWILLFQNREKLRVKRDAFFRNPGQILTSFSKTCDRNRFFRDFTFFSILFSGICFPFFCTYHLLRILVGYFFSRDKAWAAAAVGCLFIGLSVPYVFPTWFGRVPDLKNPEKELMSNDFRVRSLALLTIAREKKEIGNVPKWKELIRSPFITDRFGTARALGVSRNPDTFPELIHLLDDPQVNVEYKAFEALGIRRDRRAIPEILKRISASDHWYVQLYAYKALRRLGWRQKQSR